MHLASAAGMSRRLEHASQQTAEPDSSVLKRGRWEKQ